MLRSPVPGRVSTRLVPPLTDIQAAGLYSAFLIDLFSRLHTFIDSKEALSASSAFSTSSMTLVAAYTPEEGAAGVGEFIGAGVEMIEQHGDGLGERIENLFKSLFEAGYTSVIIVGSDSPDLPMERIETAVALLCRAEKEIADVVIGPAVDGGYYLIGMNRGMNGGMNEAQRELFKEIPWSTSEVLETTLEQAASIGIEVTLIDEWHDIDTPEDLLLLKENRDAPESARFAASCGLFASKYPSNG
jgi:hypothetical protein